MPFFSAEMPPVIMRINLNEIRKCEPENGTFNF